MGFIVKAILMMDKEKPAPGCLTPARLLLGWRVGRRSGLQALQIIGGALGMGRSLEDGVFVVPNDFQPVADIVGVVFPDLRGDAEVGTQESGAEFCNQLLAGIACVAETLAAEVTVETCCMACPVREFVKRGGIVAFLVLERLKRRELDVVADR